MKPNETPIARGRFPTGVLLALVALAVAAVWLYPPKEANAGPSDSVGREVMRAMPAQSSTAFGLSKTNDYTVKLGSAAIANTWAEFPATDIPAMLRFGNKLQIVTITNRHASGIICLAYYARATSTTDCGAAPLIAAITDTCTDGSTAADQDYVLAGAQRRFVIAGDQCVYVRSSANPGTGHLSLVAR